MPVHIELSGPSGIGLFAIVDDCDAERVVTLKWYASREDRKTRPDVIYAQNTRKSRRPATLYLHRFITSAPRGVQVDHINGNGLDCRRANLRFASPGQNRRNAFARGDSSIYKGVSYSAQRGRWRAAVKLNGEVVLRKEFGTEEEAARAYDAAAREHFGRFARLNFPQPGECSAILPPPS